MIKEGVIVKVHYTVESEGKIVETTAGKPPVSYIQGQDQLLKSIQKQLEGRKVGDVVEFELSPQEAYGLERPEAFEEIPKSEVPQWEQVRVGMYLKEPQKNGKDKVGRVAEIKQETLVLNFNHPMAGKSLKYSVEILDIIGTS